MLCGMSTARAMVSGGHRYGVVLLLTIAAVVDSIVAPDTPASRAVGVLLQGGLLLGVIATSRERRRMHGLLGVLLACALLALAVAVGLSAVPRRVGSATAGIVVASVLVVLVRGVARLIGEQGVTLQAVAGALAIYLLVGLTFAMAINLIALLGSAPHYFAQGTDGTQSEQVYFSFTTMTTTGYGDLTPATQVGHALAVLEMLIGQIYLVTVIGLLVGNLNRRARASEETPAGGGAAGGPSG
jgi:Ion channel